MSNSSVASHHYVLRVLNKNKTTQNICALFFILLRGNLQHHTSFQRHGLAVLLQGSLTPVAFRPIKWDAPLQSVSKLAKSKAKFRAWLITFIHKGKEPKTESKRKN